MISLIGFVGTGVNGLFYKKLLESGEKKYAFDIVQLANEIIEETRE